MPSRAIGQPGSVAPVTVSSAMVGENRWLRLIHVITQQRNYLHQSASDIIALLVQRKCPDITHELDLGQSGRAPISGGGFGDIYKGVLNGGRGVAIKCARLYLRQDDEKGHKVLKHAARELYIWSRLKHDNVLPLLGLAQYRDQMAMISPWMDNGTLLEYIERNPTVDRCQLFIEISEGMAYLHKNGTIHGDIKGGNVLVSHEGVAKLADFGCTQLRQSTLCFTTTTSGAAISVRWAAPEVIAGVVMRSREADVYAFGMTLLEAITGTVPFSDKADVAVLYVVCTRKQTPGRPEKFVSFNLHQADLLWRILLDSWAFEPSNRPDSRTISGSLKCVKWYATQLSIDTPVTGLDDLNAPQQSADNTVFGVGSRSGMTGLTTTGAGPSAGPGKGPGAGPGAGPSILVQPRQPPPPKPKQPSRSKSRRPKTNIPPPQPVFPPPVAEAPIHPIPYNNAFAPPWHHKPTPILPEGWIPETTEDGKISLPPAHEIHPSPLVVNTDLGTGYERSQHPVTPNKPLNAAPKTPKHRADSQPLAQYSPMTFLSDDESPIVHDLPFDPLVPRTPAHYGRPLSVILCESPTGSPEQASLDLPFDPLLPRTPEHYGRPLSVVSVGSQTGSPEPVPVVAEAPLPRTSRHWSSRPPRLGMNHLQNSDEPSVEVERGMVGGAGPGDASKARKSSRWRKWFGISSPVPPVTAAPGLSPVPPPVAAPVQARTPAPVIPSPTSAPTPAPRTSSRAGGPSNGRPSGGVRSTLGVSHSVPMAPPVGSPRRPDVVASKRPTQQPKQFTLTQPNTSFTDRNQNKTRAMVERFQALRDEQDQERQRQWDTSHGVAGEFGPDNTSMEQSGPPSPAGTVGSEILKAVTVVSTSDEDDWPWTTGYSMGRRHPDL
ncbi:hypothetical protein FS749_006848 [Ceratobasidium sp. UAMH 11750]|nr:hypothetical protein FS749_006848 [Ceratobasidium sp. UAMH 11750]